MLLNTIPSYTSDKEKKDDEKEIDGLEGLEDLINM